jgi:hypothetical protein
MKGGLLRIISAAAAILLTGAVVFTDHQAQRPAVEEVRSEAPGLRQGEAPAAKRQEAVAERQEGAAAGGTGGQGPVREATQRVLQSQIRESQAPLSEVQRRMEAAQRLLEDREKQQETYALSGPDGGKSLFTNKVDGYTVEIPGDMEADMRYSSVRAVLENESLRLEIYRQEVKDTVGPGGTTASGIKSYVNYSNRFIENKDDHRKELAETVRVNGRDAYVLQWSRRALARVENDRRHYLSVDVPLSEREVITFLFKSSEPLEITGCLDVVKSLELVGKTAEPYVRKMYRTVNTGWDEKTAAVYEEYFGGDSRLCWGIFENGAPLDFTELKKIESKLDFTFPIVLYYTGILENRDRHPGLAAALANAEKEGRILELTMQTKEQAPGKGNMVYDVLDGAYDTYLKNYAREVADSGEPVLFRPGNEMNGDWCPYSAWNTSKDTEIFKDFYRYVYQIFRDAGADNVIWVWNPNGRSFPDYKWNDELCYYPGDEYVDVAGMTCYNTGTYYKGEPWSEFGQMYDPLYEKYASLCEKPLMITEFSSSSVGGSKEAWVENMFRHIQKYDRLRAAVWWGGCDWDTDGNVARPYFIDETEGLVRLFRENLARYK